MLAGQQACGVPTRDGFEERKHLRRDGRRGREAAHAAACTVHQERVGEALEKGEDLPHLECHLLGPARGGNRRLREDSDTQPSVYPRRVHLEHQLSSQAQHRAVLVRASHRTIGTLCLLSWILLDVQGVMEEPSARDICTSQRSVYHHFHYQCCEERGREAEARLHGTMLSDWGPRMGGRW